ncbi:MAG: glycosyltransferase family 4 protein [Bacteroidota bacterium]
MNKQANILFTATFSTPFIREDITFLQKHFSVTPVISSGPSTFFRWIPALFRADVTFSWFASVYSSILVMKAKFLGARSVIVLGGVDVANIPELNYGIWNSWWKAKIVRYGIVHADVILAVDESLKQDAMRLAAYDGKNIRVIPTGYDPERWKPAGTKEPVVLTVAHCDTVTRAKVKGIDFLADVARSMPEQQFRLIGIRNEIAALFSLPSNITARESVPQEELLNYYRSAAVYFQPSRREGLPNTLCEAMLCGCSPVGTNAGGIANAIGSTGSVIPFGETEQARTAIIHALSRTDGNTARERIMTLFTKQQRETQLLEVIHSLTHAK